MSTENARVTREEAAEMAGVSLRTINRWREKGLLGVQYDPKFREPATYDPEEVMAAAGRKVENVPLPGD